MDPADLMPIVFIRSRFCILVSALWFADPITFVCVGCDDRGWNCPLWFLDGMVTVPPYSVKLDYEYGETSVIGLVKCFWCVAVPRWLPTVEAEPVLASHPCEPPLSILLYCE